MDTNTTRTPALATQIDLVSGSLTIRPADTTLAPITIKLDDLAPELVRYAALHGLKQRLIDAAAIPRNMDTGRSASVLDKYDAVCSVRNVLMSGEWSKTRESGSGGASGLLLRAIVELYPQRSRSDIEAWLRTKSVKEQNQLRSSKKIADVIARLRPETDASALLNELDSIE